jgi:hypothetical protein
MLRLSVTLAVLALASSAAAQQPCFTVGSESARAQYVVGLHGTFRLAQGCEYATAPGGPWVAPGALLGRDTDFLETWQHAGASGAGDPRLVLGRRPGTRRGQEPTVTTVLLRYCAHYLLEEQLGFRVIPQPGGGGFRVERVAGEGSCDAALLELRAVRGAREERLYGGPAEHTLGTSQQSLALGEGDWSLYAARPGGALGLRIGVFRSQRVVTPLANHLRGVGLARLEPSERPLFAARWDAGSPGLSLAPTDIAMGEDLLWPELRTAADANLLWLAQRSPGDTPPTVIGALELVSGEPSAVRLPDRVVRDHMRARYGPSGESLAPAPSDWRAIFAELAVCLTPSYHAAQSIAAGAAVPDTGACASLGGLTILAQVAGEARFCLRRGTQIITASGVRHEPGEPECFPIPAPDSTDPPPYRMMVAGDRVSVQGEGLCTLLDNTPIEPGSDGEIVLERSGLFEVRQAGGEGCAGAQGLSRLRLPVVDPQRDWHPVGLYTTSSAERLRCSAESSGASPPARAPRSHPPELRATRAGDERTCPWRALEHDESDVFAFVEPRHELAFRMSASPLAAAALNADPRARGVHVTQEVPVLAGVRGAFEGAPDAAIQVYVSRDAACPSRETTFEQLRGQTPIDADDLAPDSMFYAHLISVEGAERPVTCLARAGFRVRPSRALAAITFEEFVGMELGVLGDTQLVFFASTPFALGVSLPLVWFRLALGQRYAVIEIAGNLVGSVAVEPITYAGGTPAGDYPALSRLGVSLSWAASFGVPEWNIPRLISIGGMLHGAAESHPVENPIVSFFIGLNMAALIDLAGGR